MGTCCQLFFAWRIKVLTGKWWLTSIVTALSIISGLAAIGSGIAVSWVVKLAEFDKFQPVGCLWLATTAVVDILITAIMTVNLVSVIHSSAAFHLASGRINDGRGSERRRSCSIKLCEVKFAPRT